MFFPRQCACMYTFHCTTAQQRGTARAQTEQTRKCQSSLLPESRTIPCGKRSRRCKRQHVASAPYPFSTSGVFSRYRMPRFSNLMAPAPTGHVREPRRAVHSSPNTSSDSAHTFSWPRCRRYNTAARLLRTAGYKSSCAQAPRNRSLVLARRTSTH